MKRANEKGSVTLFVLVSMMFFLIVLVLVYSQQTEKITVQKRQVAEIQKNYQTKDIEQIYQETYHKNKPKPVPTGIWASLEGNILKFYIKEENAIAGGGKSYGNVEGIIFSRDNTDGVEKPTTPWYADREQILHAVFVDPVAPEYMTYYFSDLDKLLTVDMTNVEMGRVTNMRGLFLNCIALTEVKTGEIDTSSVTDMGWMFLKCSNLVNLDVSSFDTSNVTDMYAMFHTCNKLKELDVSSFDTSKVTNMGSMFANMTALTQLDLSNFDTSNVTNMVTMFYWCENLTKLNLSSFDTSKVTNMRGMFNDCHKLTTLDVSKFNTSNVTNMGAMFSGMRALTQLDVSNFDTSAVTNMENMFYNLKLTQLDLSSFDTSKVTTMKSMFQFSNNLKTIYVGSKWKLASVQTLMFDECGTSQTTLK